MKKAKRILALLIAVVMIGSAFCPQVFARNDSNDYEAALSDPTTNFNNVAKFEFSPEQAAGYVLDMLDQLLYEANIHFDDEMVLDESYASIGITADLRNIDAAMLTLYNVIKGVNGDEDCLKSVVSTAKLLGISLRTSISIILKYLDLGDIEDLVTTGLGNQRATDGSRVFRNVPYNSSKNGSSDLTVFYALTTFLSANRNVLKKVASSDLDLGLLDGAIKKFKKVGPILNDLPGFLNDTLYSALINDDADEAPSGWNIDTGLQQIVNWLLITGTGKDASDGGKSVLGAEFEAFLPCIQNQPGAATIGNGTVYAVRGGVKGNYNMNFYQLVSNAINALLEGMVSDLLFDVLIDALDIDASVNDGKGDPDVLADPLTATILGAVEGLLVANGAPSIIYSDDEQTYPVPKIQKLLHWLFAEGALNTFINISYDGIMLTDNFMSLFIDLARLLPGLFPLLGFEVPDTIKVDEDDLSEKKVDATLGALYTTLEGEEIYLPDAENAPDNYAYVSDGRAVNTTDSSLSTYRNPKFIREECVISNSELYAYLIKILLNNFVDGCYFPEYANSISVVGAYALASLAAQYIPENNYFDRLDAYYYKVICNDNKWAPLADSEVEPLKWTENVTLPNGKEILIPRAAMDIGASLGAYFLNGVFDIFGGLNYWPDDDTNFECYLYEFILWGVGKFMPIFAGTYNTSTGRFQDNNAEFPSNWTGRINQAVDTVAAQKAIYGSLQAIPAYNNGNGIGDVIFSLLDDTVFKLIPASWMPQWLAENGSMGVFDDWLLNSVAEFDLQKIFAIFEINPSGELAQNSVVKVILNLLDRILGTLFGGNAVLPNIGTITTPSARRNVYNTPTNLTSLAGLITNSGLGALLESLLYYLNGYAPLLCETALPLIISIGAVKSHNYKETHESAKVDYIGNNNISLTDLKTYYENLSADLNANVAYGDVAFSSTLAAQNACSVLGKAADDYTERKIDGTTFYVVDFPMVYGRRDKAEKAAVFFDNSYVSNSAKYGGYVVMQSMNYQTATATLTEIDYDVNGQVITSGTVDSRDYVYTNFHRAMANQTNGSYRTGSLGEVVYQDGYRTLSREDFPSLSIKYINRFNNAVEDAGDFIGDYEGMYTSDLPKGYAEWMDYFVNLSLKNAGIYDKNGDGTVDGNDGYPSTPDKDVMYPFYQASGSTVDHDAIKNTNTTYSFANFTAANYELISLALQNAANNNPVTLNAVQTEAVVRLALGSIAFDITPKADGTYAAGSTIHSFDALSATDKAKITTTCNKLGYTYNTETNVITRPLFALITTNMFGTTLSSITVAPPSSFTIGAEGDVNEAKNDIQKSYVAYAKGITEAVEKLKDNYDNMSWRAAMIESQITSHPNLTTLNWVLEKTKDAYYPVNQETGKNKTITVEGGQVITIPVYSKSSYDAFQKAYDYGTCLKAYVDANGTITQSLITEAYKTIWTTYLNLVEFTGRAEWDELLALIAEANGLLNGDFGLNPVNSDISYTRETITDLNAATIAAQAFYDANALTADQEFQASVDERKTLLNSTIQALLWTITNPGLQYTESENYGSISNTITSTTSDVVTKALITGIKERLGIKDPELQNSYSVYGVNMSDITDPAAVNGKLYAQSAGGYGTGSAIQVKAPTLRVSYTAVLFGDLNGDAFIDNNDAAILDSYIAANAGTVTKASFTEDAMYYAADADGDGNIDQDDVQLIYNYFNHTSGTTINQNREITVG